MKYVVALFALIGSINAIYDDASNVKIYGLLRQFSGDAYMFLGIETVSFPYNCNDDQVLETMVKFPPVSDSSNIHL